MAESSEVSWVKARGRISSVSKVKVEEKDFRRKGSHELLGCHMLVPKWFLTELLRASKTVKFWQHHSQTI